MARLVSFMFALLLLFGHQQIGKCEDGKFDIKSLMGNAGTVLKVGKEIYTGIDYVYKKLLPTTTKDSESDAKIEPGMEQRLTDQIKHVAKKLDSLKVDMQNMKDEIIDKISNEIPDQINLKSNLFEIYLRINQIENSYEEFLTYVRDPHKFSNDTLKRFAKAVTSPELTELPNVLKTIHWLLVQTDVDIGDSVLTVLSRSTQIPRQMCKTQQSLQQMIYNLYNAIALTDVKGYAMILFGHHILQYIKGTLLKFATNANSAYSTDDKTSEIQVAEEQFERRITTTMKAVAKAMKPASRAIWTCDTYGYKEGVTYTKLNNVFQKYFINEVDLNPEGTCTKTCPEYKQTKAYGCFDDKICAKQRTCSGDLWECEHKVSSTMYICASDKKSDRRYEYVEYGNSQRYGPKGRCANPAVEVYGWGRGFSHCTYCLCTCDDLGHSNSDRYKIHLLNFINSVVTGVRFRKSNNIIHIQIQQGQLLPGGIINQTTVSWVPIEDYKINEPMPGSEGTRWEYVPVAERDYHVLEWKVKRELHRDDKFMYRKAAVNLDDLDFADQGPSNYSNYLVGGLRFTADEVKGSGYHLNLDVYMVPFDYTTGKLRLWEVISPWFSSARQLSERGRLIRVSDKVQVNLENLDVPTNSGAPAVPTSQSNQFLYFTTTGLDADAGQTTIPFIDLKPVQTYPPTPLSGAGLFHKSSPGSGGFLSFKLFTYDYSSQLQIKND
ncbi:hypothetical protein TSAR_015176 [Trichomalopsis sarcophagae]|uniref:Vitellogenin domain-containing protein n=1 Tax=Trichomalopsis sarcophagae TaxID=543379 RepID=A0A232FE71_9HYME|nr:hypothetical protein TSAR_015176 [Trichomalopsis sarcophagae]